MMRAAAILAAMVGLAGCASDPQIVVRTERVEILVPTPCRAPDVKRPEWALDSLPAGATLFQRVQSMAVELEQRAGYEKRLEAAVKACQ